MNYTMVGEDAEFLVEIITRTPVFDALAGDTLDRRDLEDRLGISRTTCHRIIRTFEEQGLLVRVDGGYELTGLGHMIHGEVERFRENVRTATNLEQLFAGLDPIDIEFNPEFFVDATVTRAEPENPYPPINRFMELLRDSSKLLSLDKTSIAPLYVEEIAEQVVEEGLTIEAIYGEEVVTHLLSEYATVLKPAFETDRCTFQIHNGLSFGLSIFDQRVGVRAYDAESGGDIIFVDTASAEAHAWGEELFVSYREDAHPLAEFGDFPAWATC